MNPNPRNPNQKQASPRQVVSHQAKTEHSSLVDDSVNSIDERGRIRFSTEIKLGIRAAFIFCSLAVIVGSILPQNHAATSNDKLVHFGAYGLISILASFGFSTAIHRYICLALVLLMGATLEVIQYFVPGRSCEFYDVVANSLGVIVAYAIAGIVLRLHHRHQLAART